MQIDIRALSKSFSGATVLDQIDWEIAPGRIVAVLGVNGAGKTTLLRCLAGILAPNALERTFAQLP